VEAGDGRGTALEEREVILAGSVSPSSFP